MNELVLITGGAGFIGTHLARTLLAAGRKVRVLDNLSPQIHADPAAYRPVPGADFVRGDVTVRADVEAALAGVGTVVHLAAETGTGQSMYEIDRYYRVNVQGTAILFDILANSETHAVRNVVLASSRSVYGEGAYVCRSCEPAGRRCFPAPRLQQQLAAKEWQPRCPACKAPLEAVATREDDRLQPASIYAATKLAQEDLVRIGASSQGLAHAVLRFQNVYGEGQSLSNPYTGILSIFSTRIRLGLSLPVYEDGEESRDFVHVDDVVAAIAKAVDQPVAQGITANVGSGAATSIMEVARLLASLMNAAVLPHVSGAYRIGDIRHNFADLARLEAGLGIRPQIAIEDGLARFVDWVKDQPIPEDMLEKASAELTKRGLAG